MINNLFILYIYIYIYKTLKNITVSDLIEVLKQCEPNAIICSFQYDGGREPYYSSFEGLISIDEIEYIDDEGNTKIGSVVGLF